MALALLSPLSAQSGAAADAVSKVTATFYGDAETAKGFTWYTAPASDGSDLQVVEKTKAAPDFSKALTFTGTRSASTHPVSFPRETVHKAEASGLKPGTAYYFRVGDAKLGLWSGDGTFRTAPPSGAFTFIDLTDTQAANEEESILSSATIAKAFATVPDAGFLAVNGDIVDNGSSEKQWGWLLGHAQGSLMNTTILPAAGNHELQRNSFIEHFDLKTPPGSRTYTGAYYSVDYVNAHFIVLNTNETSLTYADFSRAQAKWLKADAAAARARGAKWLIVLMHKGPYTTSSHATDTDINGWRGVRTRVAPMLEKLGVDLVLQGHDHIYARTRPIKEDGTAAAPFKRAEVLNGEKIDYEVDPKGTIYLIPATAGPKTYYRNKKLRPDFYRLFEHAEENHAAAYGPEGSWGRSVRGQIQNFTAVTIDGAKLTAVSYEINQSSNNARPYVIDQFGIIKE